MNGFETIVVCTNLVHKFFHDIDRSNYDAALELFWADGVYVRGNAVLSGRKAIGDAMKARPLTQITRHIVTTVYIDADTDDTASGWGYLLMYRATAETGATQAPLKPLEMVVDVTAQFRREGSLWRIARVAVLPILHG